MSCQSCSGLGATSSGRALYPLRCAVHTAAQATEEGQEPDREKVVFQPEKGREIEKVSLFVTLGFSG